MTAPAYTARELENEIIEYAAKVLRGVADGQSFSADYFRLITMATENLRDGNYDKAASFLNMAKNASPDAPIRHITGGVSVGEGS